MPPNLEPIPGPYEPGAPRLPTPLPVRPTPPPGYRPPPKDWPDSIPAPAIPAAQQRLRPLWNLNPFKLPVGKSKEGGSANTAFAAGGPSGGVAGGSGSQVSNGRTLDMKVLGAQGKGPRFQQGLTNLGVSYVADQVVHGQDYADLDQSRADLLNAAPSHQVPNTSIDQQWGNISMLLNSNAQPHDFEKWGLPTNPEERKRLLEEINSFKRPDGSIDWQAAAAAGVDLASIGIDPTNMGVGDIQNSITRDRQGQQAADEEDKARADALAEEVRAGMTDVGASLDHTGQGVQDARANLQTSIDATRETAAGMPDQVAGYNSGLMNEVVSFQNQQMRDLSGMLQAGLQNIGAAQAEALKGISDNMAADLGAQTQTARNNHNQMMAQINSNPNMPPEAKAAMTAKMNMATGAQIADQAAPVRRMYRELESSTRNTFGTLMANFQAQGASVAGSLMSNQQAVRGQLSGQMGEQYARSVQARSEINTALDGVMQAADASKGTILASLDATRASLETQGNALLLSLLPSQETPFTPETPGHMATFAMNYNLNTADYQAILQDIGLQLNQLGLEAQNMGTISGTLGGYNDNTPEGPSDAAVIGGGVAQGLASGLGGPLGDFIFS